MHTLGEGFFLAAPSKQHPHLRIVRNGIRARSNLFLGTERYVLTETQKAMVIALKNQGKSYAFIASAAGVSTSAIKSFFHRLGPAADKAVDVNCCKYCGLPLRQTEGKRKKAFCNSLCKTKWWNRNRKNHPCGSSAVCTCAGCGSTFYSYSPAKYCSRACYFQARYGTGRAQT